MHAVALLRQAGVLRAGIPKAALNWPPSSPFSIPFINRVAAWSFLKWEKVSGRLRGCSGFLPSHERACAMFSRRSLLTGSIALVVTPTAVWAQTQAEWQQNYEAVARTRVQRTTTPMLSPEARCGHRADDRAISGHRRPRRLAAAARQRPPARRGEEPGSARPAPAPDRHRRSRPVGGRIAASTIPTWRPACAASRRATGSTAPAR